MNKKTFTNLFLNEKLIEIDLIRQYSPIYIPNTWNKYKNLLVSNTKKEFYLSALKELNFEVVDNETKKIRISRLTKKIGFR